MNPFSAYMGAHLHRRLFFWFGAALVLAFVGFMAAKRLVDGGWGPGGAREIERIQTFTGNRFAEVWDDPMARDTYATAVVTELDLQLELQDAQGASLRQWGTCQDSVLHTLEVPVMRQGTRLGTVRLCADPKRYDHGWRYLLVLLAPAMLLWMLSGRVARKLSQPLKEVARLAQEIGAGNLKARANLGCYRSGEEGMVALAMNDMAEKIERQMADQRQLLAAVSHELRTPLARIRVLTEMARDSKEPAPQLDGLDQEVEEMDRLVGDLLASARLEFQAVTLRPMDLAELAAQALERCGVPADRLEVSPGDTTVVGDPTLLARAITNMVLNAQTHGSGLTGLQVIPEPDGVRVAAVDEGPGFAAGEMQRAFVAFSHNGKNGGGSLGLGLALVQRIARAHGGDARVGNRQGRGATVSFEIPRVDATVRASSPA